MEALSELAGNVLEGSLRAHDRQQLGAGRRGRVSLGLLARS